jgi:aminoglycoside phosphotransferase (APT) family kinase protein
LPTTLEDQLSTYVESRFPRGTKISVDHVGRIHGGASRETYRFRLHVTPHDGTAYEKRLILRRDPSDGGVVDTERRVEFAALRAFFHTKVPVPETFWLEEGPSDLGRPFFICEELPGEASPFLLQSPHYQPLHRKIAEQKWRILGEIARCDSMALKLRDIMVSVQPHETWHRELDRWANVFEDHGGNAQPITRAAIRWLRRSPPAPAQRITVVHGDYRSGNFLYDASGHVQGILDWEMAHLGDPLEDLAWSLSRSWCFGRDDRCGGLVPRAEAIRFWEAASGLIAARESLRWWEIFCGVKAQAIWLRAVQLWQRGENRSPNFVGAGWFMLDLQDRATLELMGPT